MGNPLGSAASLVEELVNLDGLQIVASYFSERMLRPMTVERKRSICDRLLPTGRKNSLTFGSHVGAKVSVIYHTFIETCKMCGVSTLEYFKEFFKAIMQGRTDYERSALPLSSSAATERICCQ